MPAETGNGSLRDATCTSAVAAVAVRDRTATTDAEAALALAGLACYGLHDPCSRRSTLKGLSFTCHILLYHVMSFWSIDVTIARSNSTMPFSVGG